MEGTVSRDVRVPGWDEPLGISASDIRARLAVVLTDSGGLDAATALRLAGICAVHLQLECTHWREEASVGLHPIPAARSRRPAAYVATAIERECEAIATATPGTAQRRLQAAARSLQRFVLAGEAREAGVRKALTVAARQAGLDDVTTKRTLDGVLGRSGRAA